MALLRFSLFSKIILWFFLNLLILAAILWLIFSYSFRFASISSGTAHKMDSVARQISEEINEKSRAERDKILKKYSESYNVEFFFFDNQGRQLGGREISLPTEVFNEILFPESGPKAANNQQNPPPRGVPPQPLSMSLYVKTDNPKLYWSGTRTMTVETGSREPIKTRVLAVSDSFTGHGLFFDPTPLLIIVGIIIAVSILCWLPFVRHLTKSIGQLTKATEKIADEDFAVRVSENRTDELGKLGKSVNHLAKRLSGFVGGQKRFLGDISHELNSPLARMQFALSILEDRVDDKNRLYVQDVKEEVELMSKLVGELLTYSKAGIKAPQVELEKVHLRSLVERVVERETTKETAEIEIEINENIEAQAQPELLSRAVANVVRNAVRYAANAGKITVSAENGNNQIKLKIADQGAGVPDAELEKIFDPLYRIETARSRQTGGTGLGLAIVKTCIEACQGKVFAENRIPSGLAVTFVLKN